MTERTARLKRVALSLLLAMILLPQALMPYVARADEPSETGWWWAGRPSQSFPAMFTPAPAVPEGGLYVAANAGDSVGVSALRFELDPARAPTTLTLAVAEVIGALDSRVCPVGMDWVPTEGGSWDQRPQADCDTASASGQPSSDGTTVTFDVGGLAVDDVLDVVVLPGAASTGEPPATFSASFEPAGSDALATMDTLPNPPPTPSGTSIPAPTSSGEPTMPTPPLAPGPIDTAPDPIASVMPDESASPPVPMAGRPVSGPPGQLVRDLVAADRFAYAAILVLPLVLLVVGTLLGSSLSRPIVIRVGRD